VGRFEGGWTLGSEEIRVGGRELPEFSRPIVRDPRIGAHGTIHIPTVLRPPSRDPSKYLGPQHSAWELNVALQLAAGVRNRFSGWQFMKTTIQFNGTSSIFLNILMSRRVTVEENRSRSGFAVSCWVGFRRFVAWLVAPSLWGEATCTALWTACTLKTQVQFLLSNRIIRRGMASSTWNLKT
jgi:hypothetical protein